MNIDDNPMTAGRFGVRGLPTFMIFQDGKVTATHLGAMSKSRMLEWLKESAPSIAA
jgi:thioredoxin 1